MKGKTVSKEISEAEDVVDAGKVRKPMKEEVLASEEKSAVKKEKEKKKKEKVSEEKVEVKEETLRDDSKQDIKVIKVQEEKAEKGEKIVASKAPAETPVKVEEEAPTEKKRPEEVKPKVAERSQVPQLETATVLEETVNLTEVAKELKKESAEVLASAKVSEGQAEKVEVVAVDTKVATKKEKKKDKLKEDTADTEAVEEKAVPKKKEKEEVRKPTLEEGVSDEAIKVVVSKQDVEETITKVSRADVQKVEVVEKRSKDKKEVVEVEEVHEDLARKDVEVAVKEEVSEKVKEEPKPRVLKAERKEESEEESEEESDEEEVKKVEKKPSEVKVAVEVSRKEVEKEEVSEAAEVKQESAVKQKEELIKDIKAEKIIVQEAKPVRKADVAFDSEEEEEYEEESEEEVVKAEVKRVPSGFRDANVLEVTPESVLLSWAPPSDDGGSKISSYIVVMCEGDKNKYKKVGQVSGSTLTYEVTKVKEGHEYLFRIYAENEVGIGTEAAEVISPVKIPKQKKTKKEITKTEAEIAVVAEETRQERKDDVIKVKEEVTKEEREEQKEELVFEEVSRIAREAQQTALVSEEVCVSVCISHSCQLQLVFDSVITVNHSSVNSCPVLLSGCFVILSFHFTIVEQCKTSCIVTNSV